MIQYKLIDSLSVSVVVASRCQDVAGFCTFQESIFRVRVFVLHPTKLEKCAAELRCESVFFRRVRKIAKIDC